MRKWTSKAAFAVICLCLCALTACGDGIKEETSKAVTEKTNQALQIYADLEKIVTDNGLQTDDSFVEMKKQLTEMSAKVKTSIQDATEEDGQQTVKELNRIITNLQDVKKKVEESVKK